MTDWILDKGRFPSHETFEGLNARKEDGFISVSSFLSQTDPQEKKDSLEQWRKKVGDEAADEILHLAHTRGTILHTMLENHFLKEECSEKDIFIRPAFDELIEVMNKDLSITHVYGCEVKLASQKMKIRGITDFIFEDEKLGLCIGDFKGTNKPKRKEYLQSYFIQLTLYSLMFYELYGVQVEHIVIPIVCYNGGAETWIERPQKHYQEIRKRIEYLKGIKYG